MDQREMGGLEGRRVSVLDGDFQIRSITVYYIIIIS